MKIEAFFNIYNGVENWYYVTEPSKKFIDKYPKLNIAVSIDRNEVYNFDDFKELPITTYEIDYLFTRDEKVFKDKYSRCPGVISWNKETDNSLDVLKAMPVNLSNYFIKENDTTDKNEIDFIIKIAPTDKATMTDPRYMNTIVFKTNHKQLLEVDIKKTIKNLIKTVYTKEMMLSTPNTESWLLNLLSDIPFNLNNRAMIFPNRITDKTFKSFTAPKLELFTIGYMSRVRDLETEIKMTKMMEKSFSNFNTEITIANDYTNIVPRIKAECDKRHIRYKEFPIGISLDATDFYKLKMDYSILNFFQ